MNNNNINNKTKTTSKTRIIRLYRDGSTQLGFSIRGGWEHGTGIFISEVHPGSEAAKQGLQAGDQIVRINGFSLEHAIHDDVISLVKSSSKITLKVKSVGMIPMRDRVSDALTWKLMAPASSPSLSSSPSPAWTSSDSHSDSEHDFLEANIFIELKGRSLGCSVVKGPPNNPGIYVQNVKCGEIAYQSGLEVGDQITHVNGVDVSQTDFIDTIAKLKSLPSMTLTVKKGAGRCMFGLSNNGLINHYNNNNDINNKNYNNISNKSDVNNCVQKKKVRAIVHHPGSNGNTHSRMLSTSSNCSEQSTSSSGGLNGKTHSNSDNDYSMSELETSAQSIGNCVNNNNIKYINNNNNNNCNKSLISDSNNILIYEKVKQEEERLAEERRKLEEDQQRLKFEMQRLEIEKKQLERLKSLEECNSLSNCSLSSASNSSSGSQSIGFLEEIKAMGDHCRRNLRPVLNGTDKFKANANTINANNCSKKLVTKCDNNNDKHKQHELLMEEFRRAHRRMFGDNDNESHVSDKSSTKSLEPLEQNGTKDLIKETKSLPITSSMTRTATAPATPPSKTPPEVPAKKTSGPVVKIGTYANNTYNNNRFATKQHRSVIQVRSDDTITGADSKCDISPQITIKVISTKQ